MKNEVILGSAYLAPVEYYTKLFAYPSVCVERYENYMKQTYRNRISDHGNWRHVHWNAFVAAYKHSPFFDYYADEFHRFFEQKYEFLFDFNLELCEWVCRQIDMEPRLIPTEEYMPEVECADDFRELIHPKRDYREADKAFFPKPYYQVFDQKLGFLPNLSVIDLLFNMGPESLLVLRDSVRAFNEI